MKHLLKYKLFELKKINKVEKFNYDIIKTEPIENLTKYRNHRRLKVFYHKGLRCVNYEECGREGSIITHGVDRGGNLHIDVCTSDFYPMTIDHIIPKSHGGNNRLDNLDPMCSECNWKKGNYHNGKGNKNIKKKGNTGKRGYDIKVGDIVYKRISDKYLGKVVDIRPNPYHPSKKLAAQIEERDPNSLYSIDILYKIL